MTVFVDGMKKIFILVLSLLGVLLFGGQSFAASCVDVEFVFARGSGGVYQENVELISVSYHKKGQGVVYLSLLVYDG